MKNKGNSKKVEVDLETSRDALADSLAGMINKASKDGGNSAFVLGDEAVDDPSKIIDWVSSGNDMLDLNMCNRQHGGFPVGRITELTGLEGSGKTLLAMHALAETQKKGGLAIFIDTESSLDINFVTAIGVDTSKLLYISCELIEHVFEHMETIIAKIRSSEKSRLVTIVVDSIAAATCNTEMEADHGKDGFATAKAIIISKAMRKITQLIARERIAVIFTNQLREKMNAMFGDKYTTSGGKAIAFHASLRLRLASVGKITDTTPQKNTIGVKTEAKIIKNRMGPPNKKVTFELFYDRGIDNFGTWFETAKVYNIAGKAKTQEQKKKMSDEDRAKIIECPGVGTKLIFELSDGTVYEFTKPHFRKLIREVPQFKDELYQALSDAMIMKYHHQVGEFHDDFVVEDGDDEE